MEPLIKSPQMKERSNSQIRLNYYTKASSQSDVNFDIDRQVTRKIYVRNFLSPGTQSSATTIFSVWNTMVGSTVLAVPWGLSQSGFIIGIFIIIIIGFGAAVNAELIIRHQVATRIQDLPSLAQNFLGKWGKYITIFTSDFVLLGACMSYNIFMNSSLYGIISLFSGNNSDDFNQISFSNFSRVHTGLILYFVLILIGNSKSKKFYVKIASGGTFFLLMNITFLTFMGFRAFALNKFTLSDTKELDEKDKKCDDDWNCIRNIGDHPVKIDLADVHFLLLASLMSMGFFIHNILYPIIQNNQNPEKNTRDIACGFAATIFTYLLGGGFGYFGFIGNGFVGDINQNCLDAMAYKNVFAFIIRILLFFQVFSVFSIVSFMFRINIWKDIIQQKWPGVKFEDGRFVLCNSIIVPSVTLVVVLFYPKVGIILGYVGATCGLWQIFMLPTIVHILNTKPRNLTSSHPLFNINSGINDLTRSPPRVSKDQTNAGEKQPSPAKATISQPTSPSRGKKGPKWHVQDQKNTYQSIAEWRFYSALYSLVPLLGIIIMLYTMFRPLLPF